MKRLFVWGIDSLDSALLERYREDLPAFTQLRKESPDFGYESILPPDSHTAWASIYTGMSPGEHGIVDFVDPLEKSHKKLNLQAENGPIIGRTFWDEASRRGKRVCVLFPHIGFPPWEVNGIMTARDEIANQVKASPPSLEAEEDLAPLMVLRGLPTSEGALAEYVRLGRELTERELQFSKRMYARERWDVFYTYFSVSDYLCHNFWNYGDPEDPSYPGPNNRFATVIRDLYKQYDRVLAEFRALVDEDTHFVVVSDHGHGMRPTKLVNLNEVLRRQGWFTPRVKEANATDSMFLVDKVRRGGARFINRNPWTWNAAKLAMKLVPALRRFYTSPSTVDWERTQAYISDLSGIKAYNYGGIILNKNLPRERYEPLRSEIIAALRGLRHPHTGQPLVRLCVRREELYVGSAMAKYPDLIFELAEGYGAGWGTHGDLIEESRTHNISPGSHRRDTPVLLASGLRNTFAFGPTTPMDVGPLLLDLLGLPPPTGVAGRSVLLPGSRPNEPS